MSWETAFYWHVPLSGGENRREDTDDFIYPCKGEGSTEEKIAQLERAIQSKKTNQSVEESKSVIE